MASSIKNINFYNSLFMDSFFPKNEEFFTIIHFHGGGLVEGDKGDTHKLCEQLADKGFAVYTANYSLLTEAKFPQMLYDAANAVKFVMEDAQKHGKTKGFIISGQSAGAWITLMLCLNKEYLASVGIDSKDIFAWVSESAQPTTHFNILKLERGLSPLLQRIDEAAPLYYVDEKTEFSHLLLIAYDKDIENRLEQNKLLVTAIKNFNKDAHVHLEVLPGWHCQGSCEPDNNEEYPVANRIDTWIKSIK